MKILKNVTLSLIVILLCTFFVPQKTFSANTKTGTTIIKKYPRYVWVPGHYALKFGKRLWVPGHWKRVY